MALNKTYGRDGNKQTIGSVTTGFDDTSTVVRDNIGATVGRSSERFHNTRDSSGRLVSSNTADPGLLICKK
jgi:hypothetical protein